MKVPEQDDGDEKWGGEGVRAMVSGGLHSKNDFG